MAAFGTVALGPGPRAASAQYLGDERRHHDDGAGEQYERRQRQPAQPVQRHPFMHEDADRPAREPGEQQQHQRQQQDPFPGHERHAEYDLIGLGDLAEHGGKVAPAAGDGEFGVTLVRIVLLQRVDQKPHEGLDAAFFLALGQQEQAAFRQLSGNRRRLAGLNRIGTELDIHGWSHARAILRLLGKDHSRR